MKQTGESECVRIRTQGDTSARAHEREGETKTERDRDRYAKKYMGMVEK